MARRSKKQARGHPAHGHPPKPVLTLRVGISGHRPKPERFPAGEFHRVRTQLGEVFQAIEQTLEELKPKVEPYHASQNGRVSHKIRLVSGLAEGADQFAVDEKPPHWDLDAILPFPEEEYLFDFKHSAREGGGNVTHGFRASCEKATAVLELPRDPRLPHDEPNDEKARREYWRVRNLAYARLGRFLLGQIDVLVAVWDGKREDGPGGTAEVVRGALDAGIPVVWIATLERSAPRMVLNVDDNATPVAPDANALQGPLKAAIETIISVPPAAPEPQHGKRHQNTRERLDDFLSESWPSPLRAVSYDLFRRLNEKKPLRWIIKPETVESAKEGLAPFIETIPATAGPLRERLRDIVSTRFVWADVLAIDRSHRYRSAYIKCFVLAAVLVLIALLGIFFHDSFHGEALLTIKFVLVLIEVIVIYRIITVVIVGRHERWQEKWVEYRALAEMLRSLLFLSCIGEHGYIQRGRDMEPASSGWFLWYLRATIREIGIPPAHIDGTYQNELLLAVEKHVVDDQMDWNNRSAITLAKMHHWLHRWGDHMFQATATVLLAYLGAYIVYIAWGLLLDAPFASLIGAEHAAEPYGRTAALFMGYKSTLGWLTNVVTFFAALLPAAGAAVLGIRETGDFDGFAKRAARTAEKLGEVKLDLAAAKQKLTMDSTAAVLLTTAQVMSEDLGAWQSIYGRKYLGLPG